MSDVLDDECGEQASDQDGSCCSLIFNAFDAVVGEEELRVCEKLCMVSFCLVGRASERNVHVQWRSK